MHAITYLHLTTARTARDGDATGIFNSAVPGDPVNTGSIATLSLGVNMNKQLNEVGGWSNLRGGLGGGAIRACTCLH